MKIAALLISALILSGCCEIGAEAQARRELEERVTRLEKLAEEPNDPRCNGPARYEAMREGAICR